VRTAVGGESGGCGMEWLQII